MKSIKVILIGIGLIFIFSLIFLSQNTYIKKDLVLDYAIGDIDGDNQDELLVLSKEVFGKYGKDVVVYDDVDNLTEIYREDFSKLKPWKIDTGDIDGDGSREISIGVYKETIFHPVMAKRPFIYSFKEDSLLAKWRGSRLARPFIDYTFYDIDDDNIDEIISIEILENQKMLINSYKWIGFGIEGFMESKEYDSITELDSRKGLFTYIEDNGSNYNAKIYMQDNNLVIERMD